MGVDANDRVENGEEFMILRQGIRGGRDHRGGTDAKLRFGRVGWEEREQMTVEGAFVGEYILLPVSWKFLGPGQRSKKLTMLGLFGRVESPLVYLAAIHVLRNGLRPLYSVRTAIAYVNDRQQNVATKARAGIGQ